jgi:hypothetical protein
MTFSPMVILPGDLILVANRFALLENFGHESERLFIIARSLHPARVHGLRTIIMGGHGLDNWRGDPLDGAGRRRTLSHVS